MVKEIRNYGNACVAHNFSSFFSHFNLIDWLASLFICHPFRVMIKCRRTVDENSRTPLISSMPPPPPPSSAWKRFFRISFHLKINNKKKANFMFTRNFYKWMCSKIAFARDGRSTILLLLFLFLLESWTQRRIYVVNDDEWGGAHMIISSMIESSPESYECIRLWLDAFG